MVGEIVSVGSVDGDGVVGEVGVGDVVGEIVSSNCAVGEVGSAGLSEGEEIGFNSPLTTVFRESVLGLFTFSLSTP